MSRVLLADVQSLTFYSDTRTKSRRVSSIPQLKCIGDSCKKYQPEVVRCKNAGGSGTEIDWTCEADLPQSLRFGRIEVSCEGWSRSGDPYVLKGSCGLEYRLIKVPEYLQTGDKQNKNLSWSSNDWSSAIFMIIWITVALFLLYKLLKSCFRRPANSNVPPGGGPFPRFDRFSNFFRGNDVPPRYSPPPPYNPPKDPPSQESSGPGFWTGLGLGSLGGAALHRLFRPENNFVRPQPRTEYDWERERRTRPGGFWTSSFSDNRGEGSSNLNLGPMRSSTGFGRTNVR